MSSLIEYNVRWVNLNVALLPRLKTDIVKIFIDTVSNRLKKINIKWKTKNVRL